MFQPGENALIHPDWYGPYKSRMFDIKSLTDKVTVVETDVERDGTTARMEVAKGTRWVQVNCEGLESGFTVPEHFLQRPVSAEEGKPEDEWQRKSRERREAPVVRNTPERMAELHKSLLGTDLPAGVVNKLKAAIVGCKLEWRGHHNNGIEWDSKGWYEDEAKRRNSMLTHNLGHALSGDKVEVSEEDAQAIIDAHESGEPLDRFIKVVKGERYACGNCSETSFRAGEFFETNGIVIRPTEDCVRPDGIVTSWDQNFPSGKMVVGNDFRWLTQLPDNRDINTRYGTHLQILDYANVGMALGFGIGNSSPSLFRMGDGSFEIGSKRTPVWGVEKAEGVEPPEGVLPDEDPENPDDEMWFTTIQPKDRTDKYDYCGDDAIDTLPEGCESVASICTDLWAYSIIDLDEARKRADRTGCTDEKWQEFLDGWTIEVVDIEPGKYRFTHSHSADRDAHNVTMATITRVGDADPCYDYCDAVENFDVHLSQAVQINMTERRSSRAYFGDKPQKLDAATYASYMREVVRGCVPNRDWHPKGFPNNFMIGCTEGVEIFEDIPRLRKIYYDNYGAGGFGSHLGQICTLEEDDSFGGTQEVNPSFARGVGRMLESVISFGLRTRHNTDKEISDWKANKDGSVKIVNPNYDKFDVEACRKTMTEAIGWWKALIARHPHVAEDMADFAAWMANEKAVKLWVANCNIGPTNFDRKAHDEKEAKRAAEDTAKHVHQYIVDTIGVSVQRRVAALLDMVGVVDEKEAQPGHVFVQFTAEEGDDELVEFPLTEVKLTAEAETVRAALVEKRKEEHKTAMKKIFAERD